jgi:hypothetical protein
MKNKSLFSVVIFLAGCAANHEHDGLYIANREVTGITKAWILEGNVLTVYSMGTTEVLRCKQFNDRIEIGDGEVYSFNGDGDLVSAKEAERKNDYRMIKKSERTKLTSELDKLNEAYEQERKKRSTVQP